MSHVSPYNMFGGLCAIDQIWWTIYHGVRSSEFALLRFHVQLHGIDHQSILALDCPTTSWLYNHTKVTCTFYNFTNFNKKRFSQLSIFYHGVWTLGSFLAIEYCGRRGISDLLHIRDCRLECTHTFRCSKTSYALSFKLVFSSMFHFIYHFCMPCPHCTAP